MASMRVGRMSLGCVPSCVARRTESPAFPTPVVGGPSGGVASAPAQPFFVTRGKGGGGLKFWRRQALFQGRHCFCPTPTLEGGGGSVKEAGTHSPPCPQYLPNVEPHAMHQKKNSP